MVLPPDECEPCAELEQEPGDVLHHAVFHLVLDRPLPRRDEVEDVGVFERLLGELAFRCRKRPLEIAHFSNQSLTFVQLGFNLMGQHRTTPPVFDGCLHVPLALSARIRFVEKKHNVPPRNCAAAAAQLAIYFAREFDHVLHASHGKPLDARERGAYILRKAFKILASPQRPFVYQAPHAPIQPDHLRVGALDGAVLRLGYLALDPTESVQAVIVVGEHGAASSFP